MIKAKIPSLFIVGIVLLILFASILFLCLHAVQSDFTSIVSFYSLAFLGYLYIISNKSISISLRSLLLVAVGMRVSLVFIFPQLSDDIYRFIWDGNLIHAGYNPYASQPSEILSALVPGNDDKLFGLLNSPNYYTVYPPIAQLIYFIGTICGDHYYLSSLLMKIINNGSDILTLYFLVAILRQLKLPERRVLIYAFNPLVLVELCGNLHMEAIMIMTFMGFVLLSLKQRTSEGVLLLGASIATKLMPILFLPLIWKYVERSKLFVLKLSLVLLLLFSPILLGMEWLNFGKSLDLYFGKFEFNGGLYSVLRFLGQELSGYNLIRYFGPGMALITLAYLYNLYKKQKPIDLLQLLRYCFFILTCHYFLSTTVHPWYLSFPLALSVFTRYRFIVLWSGLIMLSYINYSYDPYRENFVIMVLEYVPVLAYLFYEIKKGD